MNKGLLSQISESKEAQYTQLDTNILEDFLSELSKNINNQESRKFIVYGGEITNKQLQLCIMPDGVEKDKLQKEIDGLMSKQTKERLKALSKFTKLSIPELKKLEKIYKPYKEVSGEKSWEIDHKDLSTGEYDESYETTSLSCKGDVWKLTKVWSDGYYDYKKLNEEILTIEEVKIKFIKK